MQSLHNKMNRSIILNVRLDVMILKAEPLTIAKLAWSAVLLLVIIHVVLE